MNASKLLISTATAAAVLGAIGFAYAQSTDNNATGTITPGQTNTEPTTPAAAMPTSPAMQNAPDTTGGAQNAAPQTGAAGDMPATTNAAPPMNTEAAPAQQANPMDGMTKELPARADRN